MCTNNQSGVNSSVLKNIKIPVTPIEKQKEIATEVNRRRFEAQRFEKEVRETLEKARQEIKKIILE